VTGWNQRIIKLSLLVAVAFLLRATAYFHYPLSHDFAVHWHEAHRLLENQVILVGPAVTSQAERGIGFYQGPFYYYYLALLQLLTGNHDRLVVLAFGLINSLALIPFFLVSRRLFQEKTAWWLTTIYAINPYLAYVEATPWNPNLIPALTAWSLWVSGKIKFDRQAEYLPTLFCLLAMISQCHLMMIPLVLFFVIFTFDGKRWRERLSLYLIGSLLFVMLWSPWLVHQAQNHWSAISSLITMSSLPAQKCDLGDYLRHHGHGERCFHYIRNPLAVGRTLSLQVLGVQNLPLAAMALLSFFLTTGHLWQRRNTDQSRANIYLTLPIIFTLIMFMFYRSYIYRQYFLSVVPFGLLLLGYWQDKSYRGHNLIWLAVLLINCYFFWTIYSTQSFGGFY